MVNNVEPAMLNNVEGDVMEGPPSSAGPTGRPTVQEPLPTEESRKTTPSDFDMRNFFGCLVAGSR